VGALAGRSRESVTLGEYGRKRDFTKTPEPSGEAVGAGGERFVIQKHAARRLHYDFRLEVDGVLKSWAVPKGPSTDPRDKRLAVPTEDHPLDYIDFEGVIPKGEYGGGSVIVWDAGTYRNTTTSRGRPVTMTDALERGHVSVWLEGHKLTGGYALTRVARGADERWLLVKMRDERSDAERDAVVAEPESVLSGRTVEELAQPE
jgi:DNA ligase D-like protein (predicted 3'-phosphoesterase)